MSVLKLNAQNATFGICVVAISRVGEVPVLQTGGSHVESQKTLRHVDINSRTRCAGDSQSHSAAPQLSLLFQSHGVSGLDCQFISRGRNFHSHRCRMTRVSPCQHRSARKFVAVRNRCFAGIDLSHRRQRIRSHLKLRAGFQDHGSCIPTGSSDHRNRHG